MINFQNSAENNINRRTFYFDQMLHLLKNFFQIDFCLNSKQCLNSQIKGLFTDKYAILGLAFWLSTAISYMDFSNKTLWALCPSTSVLSTSWNISIHLDYLLINFVTLRKSGQATINITQGGTKHAIWTNMILAKTAYLFHAWGTLIKTQEILVFAFASKRKTIWLKKQIALLE